MGVTQPAVLVPEEGTWLLWGVDPSAQGLRPVTSPARASVLVAPAQIPEALVPALARAWDLLPGDRRLVTLDAPQVGGASTHIALQDGGEVERAHRADHSGHDDHADHSGHGEHDHHADDSGHGEHDHHADDSGHGEHDHHADDSGHGGHDHHAMMAVRGEPSADGLVMEDLEVEIGPVASALPTGVVARLTLDGDVVCKAEVESALTAADTLVPDPTTPAAWQAALDVTGGDGTSWIADVELERVASHARYLMTLGALVGWTQLVERARDLARALHHSPGDRVAERAEPAARRLARLTGSRRLRLRLRGTAPVSAEHATDLGLAGPNGRASGLGDDARSDHPAYAALGFTAVVEDAGDALARTLVRAREISVSLAVLGAYAAARPSVPVATPVRVEGPRGPLEAGPVDHGRRAEMRAIGQDAAQHAAARATHGLEWPNALLAIVSFDLAGWRVP